MKAIDLSKAANTSVHTIRYYERIGLLKAPRNRRNGYHEFTAAHVELLGFIRRCRAAGLSLPEIEAFVEASGSARKCSSRVADIVRRVLPCVEADISELATIRDRLKAFQRRARRNTRGAPTGADVRRLVESLGN